MYVHLCIEFQNVVHPLLQVYFGCNVARNYLMLNLIGVACFTGMSYVVKKPELDELNGLSWFGRFLAEDFFIAKTLHERCVHSPNIFLCESFSVSKPVHVCSHYS